MSTTRTINPLIATADKFVPLAVLECGRAPNSPSSGRRSLRPDPSSQAVLSAKLVVASPRRNAFGLRTGRRGSKCGSMTRRAHLQYSVRIGGASFFCRPHVGTALPCRPAAAKRPALRSGSACRFRPPLSSLAVTAECVYLPAREMLTVSHDFKVRS